MILAILPAHNEAPRIAPVITAAGAHLPVLVIDDGSTDETQRVAAASGAQVHRQSPNQGKGAALKTGFRLALEQGAAAVITLDADGQHDPAEIPGFLSTHSLRGADLIIGRREFARMPLSRRIGNTLGALIFSWAVGRRIHDNQSGYRLISRRLMEASLSSPEGGFEFEVDQIVLCLRRGWALEEIPIRTIYGTEKSHISPLRHVARFIRLALSARRAMRA